MLLCIKNQTKYFVSGSFIWKLKDAAFQISLELYDDQIIWEETIFEWTLKCSFTVAITLFFLLYFWTKIHFYHKKNPAEPILWSPAFLTLVFFLQFFAMFLPSKMMFHVSRVTCHVWHVTCDMCHVTFLPLIIIATDFPLLTSPSYSVDWFEPKKSLINHGQKCF